MSYIKNLEVSIPKIKVSTEKIVIDLNVVDNASFIVENIAGGFLSGKIYIESEYIELSTNEIEKNMNNVSILIDRDKVPSDVQFTTFLKLFTNGGDKEIEVSVIGLKNIYIVDDITKFYTINDVFKYSKNDIHRLAEIFEKAEFKKWLKKHNSNAFEIYNIVSDDTNIHRRIDNFFILNGLKNKSYVYANEKNINIDIMPYQVNNIKGILRLFKSDSGFFDLKINQKEKFNFFTIKKTDITNDDFINNDFIDIEYEINVNKMKNKREDIIFYIDEDKENKITISLKKVVNAKVFIDKTVFKDNETGFINIVNFLDIPIMCEAKTSNKNITFLTNNLLIKDKGKLDFSVNFSSFNKGVVKFFKQPYFDCTIEVVITAGELKIKKEINITLATEVLEIK